MHLISQSHGRAIDLIYNSHKHIFTSKFASVATQKERISACEFSDIERKTILEPNPHRLTDIVGPRIRCMCRVVKIFFTTTYTHSAETMITGVPKTLDECTKANTPRWNFNGLRAVGKVVSVYDGDTVTVAFNTFGLGFFMHNMRLLGIDAPEIKGISEKEKAAAIKSRDYLRAIVQDREVSFEVSETDKYGRLLAAMHCGSIDISAAMLSSGNAKPYSGGTREPYIPSA